MPDKALSLAVSANWISAIIITFALYPLAKLAIGFQGVFYFLGAFMFAVIDINIYIYIYMIIRGSYMNIFLYWRPKGNQSRRCWLCLLKLWFLKN